MLPKSLRVTLRLSDSAFAIPKSKTLISSSAEHADVARFQIAVEQRPALLAVERDGEGMRGFEELAELDCDMRRALWRQRRRARSRRRDSGRPGTPSR